jgi:ATP-binding cassette subfamily F protein 3
VVGINGAGKSTLLKALASELKPLTGSVDFGDRVQVSYFAQHVAERLSPEDTVLEAMGAGAHPDVKRQEILDLAGSLLFSGDEVRKKVRVLSGGEKSRVALGQILLKRSSCLLLDEPTNHLDFHTVEALTQAIAHYSGAVVIVSHDRGFVQRTSSKILEIRDGRAEFYPGTYDEYVWSVQKGALSLRGAVEELEQIAGGHSEFNSEESGKFNYKERKKLLEKELRALEKESAGLDSTIEISREQILKLTDDLLRVTGAAAADVAKRIAVLQAEIENSESRYLACLERHETVKSELTSFDARSR